MASVKSSIELVDKITKRLERIGRGAKNTGQEVENMRQRIETNVASPLPAGLETELESAARLVDVLGSQHQEHIQSVANLKQELSAEETAIEKLNLAYQRYAEHSLERFAVKDEMEKRVKNTEKLRRNLLKAEKAELKLRQQAEKAGDAHLKLLEQADELKHPISESEKAQARLNEQINRGSKMQGQFLGGIKRMFAAYLGWRGVRKLFDGTIVGAAELNQELVMLQAAFGDLSVGEAYFKQIEQASARTGHSVEDLTEVTRNFMQLTHNTDKLEQLTNLAHRLSLRTQGIGSAENLIQEAMRGQYTRLQRTLHLTNTQLDNLKGAVESRDLNKIIKEFDRAFDMAGMTSEVITAFEESPLQKFSRVLERFKLRFAGAGESALQRLMPLFDRIESWLESDRATRFFDSISRGIVNVVEWSIKAADFISRNWTTIESVLWAVVIVLGALKIQMIAVNAVMMLNPYVLIVTAIVLLISWLIKLWKTNDEFAAGIYRAWNALLNFFGRVPIFFYKVGTGIKDVFMSIGIAVVEIIQNTINRAINDINFLINLLNKIPGVSIGAIEHVDFTARMHLEQEAFRQQRDAAIKQMESDAEFKATMREQNVIEFLANRNRDPAAEAVNHQTDILDKWNANQLDMLGDIEGNTKKLGDEDLKWLRDAAEQKAINRYTTVTQAPQIKVEFGDIHETADVDGVLEKLKQILDEAFDSGPEGVPV